MFIAHKIDLKIFKNADRKDRFFDRDIELLEQTIARYTHHTTGEGTIAVPSGSNINVDVPFGPVAVCYGFWLEVTEDCLVSLNGGANLQIRRGAPTTEGNVARLFNEIALTSLRVINPDGATKVVGYSYVLWGDVAA